jgi:hypothetical protein
MNIGNYIMTSNVRQAAPPPPTPPAPTAPSAAVLVAQNVAVQTRTQTTIAAQAVGNAEQPRTGQSRKETGESVDSETNALTARSARSGSPRGQTLNIRV